MGCVYAKYYILFNINFPGDKTTEIPYDAVLNKVLPPDIRILAWCPVEPEFSARYMILHIIY